MYKLCTSNIIHKKECVFLKNKNRQRIYVMESHHSKCKICFKNEQEKQCFICFDDNVSVDCPCDVHSLCETCMADHINILSQNFAWDGSLKCPCKNPHEFDTIDWKYVRNILKKSKEEKFRQCKPSHYDIVEQDILTLKCPHCSRAFVDFDACCSVMCECGTFFCGLCFAKFDDTDSCHSHVLNCVLNPCNNYFISIDKWNAIQDAEKRKKIWMFCYDIWKEYGSIYTIGFMYNINKRFRICHRNHYINFFIIFYSVCLIVNSTQIFNFFLLIYFLHFVIKDFISFVSK